MTGPTSDDIRAKREFIDAYFDERKKKIAFLAQLYEEGHEDEARTLCLVYIDGISNFLHLPDTNSARKFSKALTQFGGNTELFSLVRSGWLMKALPLKSAPKGLEAALCAAHSTMTDDEWLLPSDYLASVQPQLSPEHFRWVEAELWRGSIANAVYTTLRSPGVHWGGLSYGLSFGSKFKGKEIPRIDFDNLHAALVALATHARKVSEETGEWFGVS